MISPTMVSVPLAVNWNLGFAVTAVLSFIKLSYLFAKALVDDADYQATGERGFGVKEDWADTRHPEQTIADLQLFAQFSELPEACRAAGSAD